MRVVNNHDRHRYEAWVSDQLAGFATYNERPGVIVMLHTETEDAFEGQGIGSQLASAVLDDLRSRGLQVKPVCPFFAGFIARHPEYADLVAG
jgi:predicted GNAT family acetyltransferase